VIFSAENGFIVILRIKISALIPLFAVFFTITAAGQVQFRQVERSVIESRMKDVTDKNNAREAEIKQLFEESGCKNDKLSEQVVKRNLPPNVICFLSGQTDQEIIVGAHTDKVDEGHGVVDNWSGASLLPTLYYSLGDQPRHYTYIFIGFTGEEEGLLGSEYYVRHLAPDQRAKIVAMVNLDTLGLGQTKVWASHSDKNLVRAFGSTVGALKISAGVMNVDQLGTTDSESFAEFKIPSITLHSVTQETWPILHSEKDQLSALKMDDYYASYRLIAGYLAYLDSYLTHPAPTANGSAPAK
jgi:Zn-dependent M28 family amino/carboxypeptidase